MGNKYKIVPDPHTANRLTVHPETAVHLGVQDRKRIQLRFGKQSRDAEVRIDSGIPPSELGLSPRLTDQLRLPDFLRYELRYKEPELEIGPYFGILVSALHSPLEDRVDTLSSFVREYEEIGGAVLAFSLEGVSLEDRNILGFLYHPETGRWVKGVYDYPAALFSILELSMTDQWGKFQEVLAHFHKELDSRLFNYPLFDKWEMHQWFQEIPELKAHLPETVLYREPDDIYAMLKKHKRVYIKPTAGRLGRGVMEASAEGKGIRVNYRDRNRNRGVVLANSREFTRYFKRSLTPEGCLIQQAVDLLNSGGRIVDFRLILVKDGKGEWTDIGLFSRYGAVKSVVSNITGGGKAGWGRKTLRDILKIKRDESLEWNRRMSELAVKAAKELEARGIHCGNLGLDLAVDTRRRLWILEINNQNPDHVIALLAGYEHLFLEARKANMLYCKKLAGFGDTPERT